MVTDTGVEVFADYAQADMDQGKVFLKGNLAIYQSDGRTRTNSLVRADSAEFDWENEVLLTDAIRAKMEGLILRSGKFESRKDAAGNTYLEARNASVTAEDISEPLTWISADRIRVYPEDRFSFKNLTLYYGGVPFFYFPYLSHSLNPEVGYLPIPGMRSIWGPYLLNEYGFLMGKNGRTTACLPRITWEPCMQITAPGAVSPTDWTSATCCWKGLSGHDGAVLLQNP